MLGTYANFLGKLCLAHVVGPSCCAKELTEQYRLVHGIDKATIVAITGGLNAPLEALFIDKVIF
jgi:hypothetical protein